MRILHLFSDKKLTGPAEPALNLCAELKRRGEEVLFACCSSARTATAAVERRAQELGLEPDTSFRLNKHFDVRDNIKDLRALPKFLRRQKIELVHAHLSNDHFVGGRAARRAGKGIIVLRSCYDGEGPRPTVRNRYLFKHLTDGAIAASNAGKACLEERLKFPAERIWVVEGAVDTERFSPSNVSKDMRQAFGLRPDDFVMGIIARIQPRRRFDVLLEAMRLVSQREPTVKLLIVGRGTHMKRVAVEPVRSMRLNGHVKFAGYQTGPDYIDTLGCIDAKVFLVPGTDGTCRAVREAMAMGKPVIAFRRGMLPEIVDHGVNGLVVEDTPGALAEAICHLARDRALVRSMSEEAFKKAQARFNLHVQARQVAEIYRHLSGMGR